MLYLHYRRVVVVLAACVVDGTSLKRQLQPLGLWPPPPPPPLRHSDLTCEEHVEYRHQQKQTSPMEYGLN